MNQNYEKLKKDLENLIDKFNKGWHEGIEIDASDIMLLNDLMEALSAITNAPTVEQDSEPVAWALFYENGVVNHVTKTVHPTMNGSHLKYKPLYTSPPKREWRGLTDNQITNIGVQHQSLHQVAYAISDALKEVNGYD